MNQAPLDDFIDRILAEQQFENLSPEVRAQLHADLSSRADDHVNAALLSNLSEEQLATFQKMLDDQSVSKESLQEFLASCIPDITQVVASALLSFSDLYLLKR